MGQANHFLITILVGLDAVEDGAGKRETFHTSWNPRSVEASVQRSRHYAIKSALAWAVDNLDMYLRLCNRLPKLYGKEESLAIANTKHSVYNKFKCIIEHHPSLPVNESAYVDLLICWRNTMVHFDADNQLMHGSRQYFRNVQSDDPVERVYHLDINKMIEHFEHSECPNFKEVATLISMTIRFVENLDRILLGEIDQRVFLEEQLALILRLNAASKNAFHRANASPEKRKKQIKQLLLANGVSENFYNEEGEQFIAEVSELSVKEFLARAKIHMEGNPERSYPI